MDMPHNLPEFFNAMSKVIGYLSTLSGGGILVYMLLIGRVTRVIVKSLEVFIVIGVIFLVIAYWDQIYPLILPYIPANLTALF